MTNFKYYEGDEIEHVAHMKTRNVRSLLFRTVHERQHLENRSVDWTVILKRILDSVTTSTDIV
jgi:hypothetical protein